MQHLDFCISETVGYFICVEIPSGVLILLLARREKKMEQGLEEEEKVS